MNKSIIIIAFLVGVFCASSTLAQVVYNNGQMYVLPNAIVQINGGIETDGAAAIFDNDGEVTVDNSANYPFGDFIISNAANVAGDGIYNVENNWDNSAVFTAGNSYVNLDGADQLITGSAATTFYDLELTGSGIKTQTIDATVSNTLQLNDRELATDANTMFITNTANTSVMNDQTFGAEGFVSSLGNGSLSWQTASTNVYSYPVGSSLGTARYREAEITPATNAANTYTVRLANNDPSTDTLTTTAMDTMLCFVNDFFYHKINRTAGTDAADIAIYYDEQTDGRFDALAQWNTPTTSIWNDMGPITAGTGQYSSLISSAWNDFTEDPYALAKSGPAIAAFDTATSGYFSNLVVFTDISSGATTWSWNFGDGDTSNVQDPQHEYSDPGTYQVMLIILNANGCTDTAYLDINVIEGIIVPNVFSPNGDGINDVFRIPATGIGTYKISIFNRWGTLIFESEAPEIVWDGRTFSGQEVPVGVYFYVLKVEFTSGADLETTYGYPEAGHITLVRN